MPSPYEKAERLIDEHYEYEERIKKNGHGFEEVVTDDTSTKTFPYHDPEAYTLEFRPSEDYQIDYQILEQDLIDLDIVRGMDLLINKCYDNSEKAGWWNDLLPNTPLLEELESYAEIYNNIYTNDLINDARNYIQELEAKIAAKAVPEKIALIHSEISEALEADRKDLMDDKLPNRKGLEVELADAIIRIADLAGKLKLDLGGAIIEKLEYNSTREDHKLENREKEHGKKY